MIVWLKSDKNCRRSSVLLPYGHMLTTTKKNRKNVKIENFDKRKNGLEICWIGNCKQNLTWIHTAVSEKPQVYGRTVNRFSQVTFAAWHHPGDIHSWLPWLQQ